MFNPAPDTPSPIYPDRLIRPLPKRTLRSRLSSGSADSILYPSPPSITRIFYGSSAGSNGQGNDNSKGDVQQDRSGQNQDESSEGDLRHPYENGLDFESGDEDSPVVVRRSAVFHGSSLSPSASGTRPPSYVTSIDGGEVESSPVGPDGYDAFENTNNKKKRKIPTPANLGSHHSTLSHEFANMGLSASSPLMNDGSQMGTYYGTGNLASQITSGVSGPGRGRSGRNVSRGSVGRNPLSVQHGWGNGQAANRRDHVSESTGIVFSIDFGLSTGLSLFLDSQSCSTRLNRETRPRDYLDRYSKRKCSRIGWSI